MAQFNPQQPFSDITMFMILTIGFIMLGLKHCAAFFGG